MQRPVKVVIAILVAGAVIGIIAAKQPANVTYSSPGPGGSPSGLPMLVDLGSGTCVPCKLMAPILEQLKREYAGLMSFSSM